MIGYSGGAGRDDGDARSNDGGLKKGPWSSGEDAVLIDYVKKHGEGNWNAVQRNTGLQRCGKSCRLRWANHLRPNLKKGAFSIDEERVILHLHSKLGNKWARISAHLPGRTDNEVKNYWNTRVKRRLRQGLPLYPDDLPNQTPRPPPPPPSQPPAFPLSLQKNPSDATSSLPLFDPVSLSSLFALPHPPSFLSSDPIKRPNSFVGRPVSSPLQLVPVHPSQIGFTFDSGLAPMVSRDLGMGLGLDRYGSSDINCLNFELPSNQLCQKITEELHPEKEMKMKSNMGRSNSGLLDDLLQEDHDKVRNNNMKLEREVCGIQWDISSSEISSSEINAAMKKEESQKWELNSMNEDLSNIVELIPSLVEVPWWCDESSGGQSSVDHSHNGLDLPPQHPSDPTMKIRDYNDDDSGGGYWNPSSDYTCHVSAEIAPKLC